MKLPKNLVFYCVLFLSAYIIRRSKGHPMLMRGRFTSPAPSLPIVLSGRDQCERLLRTRPLIVMKNMPRVAAIIRQWIVGDNHKLMHYNDLQVTGDEEIEIDLDGLSEERNKLYVSLLTRDYDECAVQQVAEELLDSSNNRTDAWSDIKLVSCLKHRCVFTIDWESKCDKIVDFGVRKFTGNVLEETDKNESPLSNHELPDYIPDLPMTMSTEQYAKLIAAGTEMLMDNVPNGVTTVRVWTTGEDRKMSYEDYDKRHFKVEETDMKAFVNGQSILYVSLLTSDFAVCATKLIIVANKNNAHPFLDEWFNRCTGHKCRIKIDWNNKCDQIKTGLEMRDDINDVRTKPTNNEDEHASQLVTIACSSTAVVIVLLAALVAYKISQKRKKTDDKEVAQESRPNDIQNRPLPPVPNIPKHAYGYIFPTNEYSEIIYLRNK